jgi:hypothetical protein
VAGLGALAGLAIGRPWAMMGPGPGLGLLSLDALPPGSRASRLLEAQRCQLDPEKPREIVAPSPPGSLIISTLAKALANAL